MASLALIANNRQSYPSMMLVQTDLAVYSYTKHVCQLRQWNASDRLVSVEWKYASEQLLVLVQMRGMSDKYDEERWRGRRMMMEGRDLVMSESMHQNNCEYKCVECLTRERWRGRRMMMEGRDLVMQGGNSILQVKDQLQRLPRLQALFLLFGQCASRCCV